MSRKKASKQLETFAFPSYNYGMYTAAYPNLGEEMRKTTPASKMGYPALNDEVAVLFNYKTTNGKDDGPYDSGGRWAYGQVKQIFEGNRVLVKFYEDKTSIVYEWFYEIRFGMLKRA